MKKFFKSLGFEIVFETDTSFSALTNKPLTISNIIKKLSAHQKDINCATITAPEFGHSSSPSVKK